MFTMASPTWGELSWEDGEWSGDEMLIRMVEAHIDHPVATISTGPTIDGSSDEEWKAWFTAQAALRFLIDDGVWSGEPDFPEHLYDVPDGGVP